VDIARLGELVVLIFQLWHIMQGHPPLVVAVVEVAHIVDTLVVAEVSVFVAKDVTARAGLIIVNLVIVLVCHLAEVAGPVVVVGKTHTYIAGVLLYIVALAVVMAVVELA
jgi:hypothetical protein